MAKVIGPPRREEAQEEWLRGWFDEQEKLAAGSLEEGGRQIIQLVTALFGLMFGALALGSDSLEASLHRPEVVWAGLAALVILLIALVAALGVVLPLFSYRYNPDQPATQQRAYRAMVSRKVIGLRVAVVCFGLGLAAFAGMIGVILVAR